MKVKTNIEVGAVGSDPCTLNLQYSLDLNIKYSFFELSKRMESM